MTNSSRFCQSRPREFSALPKRMAISPILLPLLLLTTALSATLHFTTADSDSSDLVSELISLQSSSKSGVIHLNDHLISRFLTSTKTPRPYSLVIFFDAQQLHSKTELHLQDLHTEFSILASSFITNNPPDDSSSAPKLFFCDIEFKESQNSFSLFGVNSLPHIRLVGQNVKNPKDSDQMDQGDFSRMAESMSEFVESRAKVSVGPIHRPPILSTNQIAFLVVVFLIWLPFFVKKVLTNNTFVHDWKVWLLGAVFVYFFSVSGVMFNIIRKMPMFLVDRNDPNKLVFFYQGSGMQLGAEGFAVGFLYTIVGLLLGVVTHVLVKVKNQAVQRIVMVISLIVSFWAVRKVVSLDNWKTGYGIHAFWPSSW